MKNILLITAVILALLFAFALFKNIAYPLLWNDEAETAMYAERILEFGYPKVHDGKNILYLLELPMDIGVNKKTDAYLGNSWGQYYFCALGAYLAKYTDNLYIKTALLRTPFALIGLLGILIFVFSTIILFKSTISKLLFFNIFILLELTSIPLILHLRQVRCYSITIFLTATIFYLHTHHNLFKKISRKYYIIIMALLLVMTFNTFSPVYFIFVITFGLYAFFKLLKNMELKKFLLDICPLIISLVPIIPLLSFFNTLNISNGIAFFYTSVPNLKYQHLIKAIHFFQNNEFLNLVLILKLVLAFLLVHFKDHILNAEIRQKIWASLLLSMFFIIYFAVVVNIPLLTLAQRYYIPLQPVLILILLLDIFIILDILAKIGPLRLRTVLAATIILTSLIPFALVLPGKIINIKNYTYELFHQYGGPLDCTIPFIKYNFTNPENLIIATNYEECAYMYYLKSKTIIGYKGNNLEEDLKMRPDIIIYRKRWAFTSKPEIFNMLSKNENYRKAVFRVYDYPVNNIPEIGGTLNHLFKTKLAEKDDERVEIYIKQ